MLFSLCSFFSPKIWYHTLYMCYSILISMSWELKNNYHFQWLKKKKLPLSSNQVNRGLAIVTKQLIFHFPSLINKIVLSCPCNVKIYQSIRWIIFASYPPWWQYYHDVATTCWSVFIHRSYSIFQSLTHLIISRIHKTYSSMFQIKHLKNHDIQ